jgi:hypothetical protein
MTIQYSIGSGTANPLREDRWSSRNYLLVILAAAAVVLGFDLLDGSAFTRDVDDLLREIEIRNLVSGAGWFDLSVPAVRMPDIYVAPWSRLVDLPYALVTWILGPAIGQERALAVALGLWPPVLGVFFLRSCWGACAGSPRGEANCRSLFC